MLPLIPEVPASDDWRYKAPLDVAEEYPDINLITPPVFAAESPAVTVTLAPLFLPDPAANIKFPAELVAESPENNKL